VKTLTVLVPFFNEERTIIDSLRELDKISISDEIILIDDGSTDSSFKLVQNFIKDKKKYKTIQSTFNKGKGDALNQSRGHITSEYVVIHDADLEYDPFDIIEMKKKSMQNTNSLILGSRFIGNKIRENGYMRTYLANKTMSTFFSVVNNYKITDIATCYKLMPAEFIKTTKIKEKGFSIEIELLSKYLKFNKSVVEVPISYSGRSYDEGKKIKTSDGFLYLFNTVRYKFLN